MSFRAIGAGCLALALGGCSAYSAYTRSAPRRVHVSKQATSEPVVLASAVRDGSGGAVLRVLELHEVRAVRQAEYGAIEGRLEHPGHPFWELLEVPMGALVAVVAPVVLFWDLSSVPNANDGVKPGPLRPFLIMLNPFQTFMGGKIRTYVAKDVHFEGEPQLRQYNVKLPVSEVELRYRVLDTGREPLSGGALTTDIFGKAMLPDVPEHAVGIELKGKDIDFIAPLAPAVPAATVRTPETG